MCTGAARVDDPFNKQALTMIAVAVKASKTAVR
jgi:hypothetical protein